jgi:hypothetical protein
MRAGSNSMGGDSLSRDSGFCYVLRDRKPFEIEVIGNIYENSELVK